MRNSGNAVSEPSEYICISCWTPFKAVPDAKGEITCPHCGFAQPAGSETGSGPTASGDGADMTMQDMRAPWLDKSGADDPIAFDNLEQLEQLLGNSGQSAPVVTSTKKETPPEPPQAPVQEEEEAPTLEADFEPVATEAILSSANTSESALQAITSESGPTIWRLKSDAGMTYSFFSLTSLVRWADGLAPQDKAALTSDGVVWKHLGDFRSELEKNENPTAAFEAAPVPQSATPAPAKATTTGTSQRPTKPQSGQTRRRPARTASVSSRSGHPTVTTERKRTTGMTSVSPEMEELMKAASESEDGGRSAVSQSSRRATSAVRTSGKHKAVATSKKSATSGSQVAFFGLGAILGAAGVYFGMYLAGFYDLVFSF